MTQPWEQAIRLLRIILDLAVACAAHYLAFVLRFEGAVPAEELGTFVHSLPCVLLIQYLSLMGCKIPESSWQYVSLLEVRRICLALILATGLLTLFAWSGDSLGTILPNINAVIPPRGVIALDLLLGMVGLIGLRVFVRVWHERRERNRRCSSRTVPVPTLLIGAGSVGAEVIKQIAADPQLGIRPIGFLDDDPKKCGMVIHGTRVLGTVAEVATLARLHSAQQALITIAHPAGEHLRRIVDLCTQCNLPTKVIPGIHCILQGKFNLSVMREVAIEDLLHREPVALDLDSIAAFVNARRILITGAGGSIGSELCRIVARFGPASLVLVEHTENNLFHIHGELGNVPCGVEVIPCLADICDQVRMEQIFASYRPEMVLHAAAYKHVPMIEWNPREAIKNNVLGTKTIADLANQFDVSEFVMISTDKAVNPTSIMGASKRIAEIYIQALSQRSSTRFVAVRFGNVLGSAGSVIPTFKEQIARGGPVTVTHPDMRRYFMTIPEACQLVLQAATLGQGGEIFILDMGEPVRIVDLARNLIGLSGFADDDIEIRFTGIRPGERLFEELALKDESAKKTRHPKIYIGRLQPVDWEDINRDVEELQILADHPDVIQMLHKIKEIVPEYEGTETASPRHAAWVRTDPQQEAAGLNGNGTVSENESAMKAPLSLSRVSPNGPFPNGGPSH
ncbi:MAG TPA: nucleoside-diphosphate sugar epimerase/dehydratase [Gemmataceae bacterium]|nr:nucleoside-diphosphate sugar epimerase/dehydratase [Gemmataceae bacterium]